MLEIITLEVFLVIFGVFVMGATEIIIFEVFLVICGVFVMGGTKLLSLVFYLCKVELCK